MAAAHDFGTWPRRGAAAKRLGVSVATLRRYEGKRINPIKDKNGDHRFDPEELDALAKQLQKRKTRKPPTAPKALRNKAPPRDPPRDVPPEPRVSGAVTKRAFEMFEQNYSRARVAIELGETVENVNWLYDQYRDMSGRVSADRTSRAVRSTGESSDTTHPDRPYVPSRSASETCCLGR